RVDDDLVGARRLPGRADLGEEVVALELLRRVGGRREGEVVVGAVEQRPGRPAVHRAEEADPPAGVAERGEVLAVGEAGAGDDDRLVRVVVAGEDRDRADVEPGARAEVGQGDVGRALRVGRQEVGRLPDPARGAGDVDGVARRVGRVDGDG